MDSRGVDRESPWLAKASPDKDFWDSQRRLREGERLARLCLEFQVGFGTPDGWEWVGGTAMNPDPMLVPVGYDPVFHDGKTSR